MKKFLSILILIPLIAWSANPFLAVVARKNVAAAAFTGIFFSGFEDQTDLDQWPAAPSSWDTNYTSDPLIGSVSAETGTNTTWYCDAFTDDTTGTVYARVAFKKTVGGTSAAAFRLGLYTSADVLVAEAYLYNDSSPQKFYRIYAADSTTSGFAPATANAFDDATYWLYLTYIRGTSVKAEVLDSGLTVVSSDWTKTHTTTDSLTIGKVGITQGAGVHCIFDSVEVRKDTSWGN